MNKLIRRCKEQNKTALGELYEQYSKQVYRTAFLLTRSVANAEDVTQETFLRVFTKLGSYDETKSFEAWLYRVTINVAKNYFRKNKVMRFWELVTGREHETPADYVLKREQDIMLWNQIRSLPYKLQSVIVLKYLNECSQEEISEILGIPVGTVKSRLNSGLKKLRNQISEEYTDSIQEVICHE
ncbi:MAG TPA: RNA polymerase sigma factor [Bacillota bacterium]|nr:RNA polymerase sigma factor [Bacillota bacterium]